MSRGVVVIGAGGHAKVCIELLQAMGMPIAFCIGGDDSPADCIGVTVLRGDSHLPLLRQQGHGLAFVAIGTNALRQRLGRHALELGYELVNAISPSAVISPTARLGRGVAVMAGAVINACTTVADLAIVNTMASVDHDGVIGEAVHIAPHCGLAGNVTVAERSFLGVGSKVIPGISIGADVVAGAGSVIVCDVPSNMKIVGVPAKPLTIKNRDT